LQLLFEGGAGDGFEFRAPCSWPKARSRAARATLSNSSEAVREDSEGSVAKLGVDDFEVEVGLSTRAGRYRAVGKRNFACSPNHREEFFSETRLPVHLVLGNSEGKKEG